MAQGSRQLRAGRIEGPGTTHLLTTVTAGRRPWLRTGEAAAIVLEALRWLHEHRRVALHAAVVMPDHVHLVATTFRPLPSVMHSFKSYTANRLNRCLGRRGPFWEPGYHDRGLVGERDVRHAIAYVAQNPARAGLVPWGAPYPYLLLDGEAWREGV
ncbi:MAG TPA: transposase [Chromatiales bacterium]|nr:transposase [Chromatiales bacterium]